MIATTENALADYITAKRAMAKLGISRSHLQRLIRGGRLRAYRLSERVLLLRLDDVQAMVEAGHIQPAAAACQSA